MLEIRNSVAVITGGVEGIGMALSEYWVANGGKVVLADVDEQALDQAKFQLEKLGGEVLQIVCNATREADCSRLADAAIEAFGKINLVAPFAGIIRDSPVLSTDKESGKMSLADFRRVLDTNLTGLFLTVRECAERMINCNCKGLICLVSAPESQGTAGLINYSSSRAAVSVMPKVLTAEFFRRGLSDRIRCIAISPGYVGTSMSKNMDPKEVGKIPEQVPIGRLIDPYEVASLVGELYRNEALAGEVFCINGGLRPGSTG